MFLLYSNKPEGGYITRAHWQQGLGVYQLHIQALRGAAQVMAGQKLAPWGSGANISGLYIVIN